MSVKLTLPCPISANRYWRHYGSRIVLSKEALEYRRYAAHVAMQAKVKPISGDVAVKYTYHPKARKKETGKPMRRLDLGNVEKVASDALNGLVWYDDKQIVKMVLELGEPVLNGCLIVEWENINDVN